MSLQPPLEPMLAQAVEAVPGLRFAAAWRSQEMLDVILVHPDLVAGISADTAIDHGGVHRHPVRFKRLRLDITTEEVPLVTTSPATDI
ncbi:hypothetical protein ACWENO_35950 [Streptomyces sp. NPDC004436]